MTSVEYYKLKVRPIYRVYPVYLAGREPAGYMEALKQKEPEIVFDASKLHTEEDWIRAGEMVFEAPQVYRRADPGGFRASNPALLPLTNEGITPHSRYVIRRKGLVEVGVSSCASCHSRVLPGGAALKGAQFDIGMMQGSAARERRSNPESVRSEEWITSGAPWAMSRAGFDKIPADELIRRHAGMQGGVLEREGTSSMFPTHAPTLIGLKDIKYLDATGTIRHRSIGDLMRYVIIN